MSNFLKNKSFLSKLLQLYGIAFITIAVIMAIAKINNVKISVLVDDPAAYADYPVYVGLLSMAGILIWGATAAICLFSVFALKPKTARENHWQRFILVSGLLSLALVIDDLWLIHENYATWLGLEQISLPTSLIAPQELFESLIFGLYGIVTAAYLYYFRNIFKQTRMLALLAAIACFALSVAIDVLGEKFAVRHHHIPEEIFKLLGITGWLFYFSLTCRQALRLTSSVQPTTSEIKSPQSTLSKIP